MSEKKPKSVTEFKKSNHEKLPQPEQHILSEEEGQKFTFKSPFPQEFSIPSNILYYVSRNPVFPKGHLKLISTCKSFFRMSRIIPIEYLEHYSRSDDDDDDEYTWEADRTMITLNNKFYKFWGLKMLFIKSERFHNIASNLVKHSCKFSFREMFIHYQVLTFEELQILVSGDNLEDVCLNKTVVKNSDGSITEFERVFELLCCRKRFDVRFHPEKHGINKNTTKKIIEILSSDQVPDERKINFSNIPSLFNFFLFSDFLKSNMTGRQHTIDLNFKDGISDAYKNQLQNFVNEIIQIRGIYAHTVPMIDFPRQDWEAYKKLWKMQFGKVDGILKKTMNYL